MARVTVEDCLHGVDNRFQLILVASKRARQICDGSEPLVALEGDKPTVLALREISEGFVGREILEESDERLMDAEIADEMALEMGDAPALDADF